MKIKFDHPHRYTGKDGVQESHGLGILGFTEFIELRPLDKNYASIKNSFIEVESASLPEAVVTMLSCREQYWMLMVMKWREPDQAFIVKESDIPAKINEVAGGVIALDESMYGSDILLLSPIGDVRAVILVKFGAHLTNKQV